MPYIKEEYIDDFSITALIGNNDWFNCETIDDNIKNMEIIKYRYTHNNSIKGIVNYILTKNILKDDKTVNKICGCVNLLNQIYLEPKESYSGFQDVMGTLTCLQIFFKERMNDITLKCNKNKTYIETEIKTIMDMLFSYYREKFLTYEQQKMNENGDIL